MLGVKYNLISLGPKCSAVLCREHIRDEAYKQDKLEEVLKVSVWHIFHDESNGASSSARADH